MLEDPRERVAVGGVPPAGRPPADRSGWPRRTRSGCARRGRRHPRRSGRRRSGSTARATVPAVGEDEVQEPGSGDLGAVEIGAERLAERGGESARRPPRRRPSAPARAASRRWWRSPPGLRAWDVRARRLGGQLVGIGTRAADDGRRGADGGRPAPERIGRRRAAHRLGTRRAGEDPLQTLKRVGVRARPACRRAESPCRARAGLQPAVGAASATIIEARGRRRSV